MSAAKKLDALVYNGVTIRESGERLNLTDMHNAAGSPKNLRPVDWLRLPGTVRLIEHLKDELFSKWENHTSELVSTKRGGAERGSTEAHWKLGLAYAADLDPSFKSWCLDVVRERMEGKLQPANDVGIAKFLEILDRQSTTIDRQSKQLDRICERIDSLEKRPNDGGAIGTKDAKTFILIPLREIADTWVKNRRTSAWRSKHRELLNRLRDRLKIGVSGSIATRSAGLLTEARDAVDDLRKEADRHCAQVEQERQLKLWKEGKDQ